MGRASLPIPLRMTACAILFLSGGCTGDDPGVTVFAASSLTEVMDDLQTDASFQFAGSDELALQISEGATPDVFVSAAETYVDDLFERGLVEQPVPVATSRLVLIVPARNPASIASLEDAARDGVKLVMGAPGVPVGDYARDLLRTLGRLDVLDNVVSNEEDVRAVLGKVALGEADAGFVYATDVAPVEEDVVVIELPERAQPDIIYSGAVVAASDERDAAAEFLAVLTGSGGRELLREAGFGLP